MKTDSTVVRGRTFLVTDLDGRAGRDHDGFYHRDTRHLDRWGLDLGDRRLETLEVANPTAGERRLFLCSRLADGARDLRVTRRQVVTDGLYERLHVENLTSEPLSDELALSVGTAFDDLFEVRGHESPRERDVAVEVDGGTVRFRYDPPDLARRWATTVRSAFGSFDATPESRGTASEHRADATVRVPLEVGPRERVEATVAVAPRADAPPPRDGFAGARAETRKRAERWRAGIERRTADDPTDDRWRRVLDRSRADLLELRLDTEHGPTFAAGVPWFATEFGRDSLLAAYQAVDLVPEVAKGTCRFLAAHQAEAADEFRAAEPGKILHEFRHGEAAERGNVPHSPYYGTVDATALFVVVAHEAWRRTGDEAFAEHVWPAVDRALDWIDDARDPFLSYPADHEGPGLTHQAWKDSGDGIMTPDGSHPAGPLAVAEVQGYVYDAKRRAADLARSVVEDEARAAALDGEATALRRAFDEAFWLPEESFYAVALDGTDDPVRTVASNPGHCLWSGIVPEARADAVVDRLVGEDLYSGWGIRTVSSDHPVYNPQSYHLGSVWPHDSSIAALGMARYGRPDAARRVADGLVDAAVERGTRRLPELFAGFPRDETDAPIEYGTACEPQAWAAAAPIACHRAARGDVRPGR